MTPGFLPLAFFKQKSKAATTCSALLVILSLLLAACGGSSANTASKTHILRIASHIGADFTKTFSPYDPTTAGVDGTRGMLYETLYYFNTYNGSSQPVLATSYEWNSDNTQVTFHLRKNVKWSDSKPFTADDVVFTFNLLKQYPAADTKGIWSYLTNVTSSDANTVVVTFKKNYPPALWFVAGQTFIVPQHTFAAAGDPTKFINDNPVGTGPYTLKSFSPTLVTYKKNPNFWDASQVQVDELQYPSIKDNTVVQEQLLKGTVDWGGFFAPDLDTTFVAKDQAHNHYWMSPVAFTMIYLNLTKAPFNQVPVRQAISYALDRQQMSQQAESGYEPIASPTGLVPGQLSNADPQYQSLQFTQDKNKAIQLLQSAGFTKGSDGIFADKNGKKMSYQILVPAGWTDWEQICQVISQNLKDIGIDVKVNPIDQNAYFAARGSGDYDMLMGGTALWGPTPFYLYNELLNSTNSAPIGKAAPSNWERWQNTQTDQLLNQLATSTDTTTQKQALSGLQKIMVEQQPTILLLGAADWYIYSTKNFTGFPSKENPYALGATYEVPDNEQVILHLKPA